MLEIIGTIVSYILLVLIAGLMVAGLLMLQYMLIQSTSPDAGDAAPRIPTKKEE